MASLLVDGFTSLTRPPTLNSRLCTLESDEEEEDGKQLVEDGSSEVPIECAVCLQTCVYPVQLPCKHIFCFLCVKGVTLQSKRLRQNT